MIPPESPAISVNGLTKRFGRKQALDGMTFSIPRRTVAGFLGPNGAGKTTTLRLLLGLASCDAGEMELLGCAMPKYRRESLEQTGTLVEHPSFIESFSGFENLIWFGSLNKPVTVERAHEVLAKVGLTEAAHQSFGTYSTGMKQRLGVGFAIIHRPALLVLDEPTNGMDPQGRVHMREIIKEIHESEGSTVFLSSHLLDEIQRLCDYVVIVDKGHTIREGYVEKLLHDEQENWEIRLTENDANKAIELCATMDFVLSKQKVPRGIEFSLKPETSAKLNQALISAGIAVSALIPKEASLEKTFLELTDNGQGNGEHHDTPTSNTKS